MYLVDTSVWLERLLDQERSQDVGRFLESVASSQLFMTDFSLHSLAIVLVRLQRRETLLDFVRDAFLDGGVGLLRLGPEEMGRVVTIVKECELDFDDAYQCVAAERHDLTVVSFDRDFDRTPRGRKEPSELAK